MKRVRPRSSEPDILAICIGHINMSTLYKSYENASILPITWIRHIALSNSSELDRFGPRYISGFILNASHKYVVYFESPQLSSKWFKIWSFRSAEGMIEQRTRFMTSTSSPLFKACKNMYRPKPQGPPWPCVGIGKLGNPIPKCL